jgi:hypothetical protein
MVIQDLQSSQGYNFMATLQDLLATAGKIPLAKFDSLVLPKTSGSGSKVDTTTPTYGFRDLLGPIIPGVGGSVAPAFTTYRGGNAKAYAFDTGDKIDQIVYHIPHDYVPGTDIFMHPHWGHNGTAISGSLIIDWHSTYSKGHNQASQVFHAEKNLTQTISTPDVATFPQYGHFLNDIQMSVSGGSATLLDSDLFEPDGIIMVAMILTTKPTITGSAASNLPYIFTADIHYQSTNMATKAKAPDFYV